MMKMVEGVHHFTLERYSRCKASGWGQAFYSASFTVGGHQWAVAVYPDGLPIKTDGKPVLPPDSRKGVARLAVYYALMSDSKDGKVRTMFGVTLLDQSGAGNHLSLKRQKPTLLKTGQTAGLPWLIEQKVLDRSPYLMYDCLKIKCSLSVLSESEETIIPVPRDDVGASLLTLLKTGEGADVVFDVGGKRFKAHKMILSARSSFFAAMFSGENRNPTTTTTVVEITDVEKQVFEVLLYFIYSDTLPEDKHFAHGYAFGQNVSSTLSAKLLAAADKYGLKRLKSICESHIWRSISFSRFKETVQLAHRYNASELNHLCIGYAVDHCDALTELDSFSSLHMDCPWLSIELGSYLPKTKLDFEYAETRSRGEDVEQFGSLINEHVESSKRK